MDDPDFRQKYQKYKLRVKVWEKDFKRKHSRIPSKHDIREAPQQIRDAYKMYYKLKTSFLEDTLNDVLAEDGFDVLEISQTEMEFSGDTTRASEHADCDPKGDPLLPRDIVAIMQENGNGGSTTATDVSNREASFSNLLELSTPTALTNLVNADEQHVIKSFEAVDQLATNASAWGSEVSKRTVVTEEHAAETGGNGYLKASLKSNLSQKLFKAASFSKRNPRKSLSRAISDSGVKLAQKTSSLDAGLAPSSTRLPAQSEPLPDLETILMQKAKEQQTLGTSVNPLLTGNKSKDLVKTKVDEGWLQRTAAVNGISMDRALKSSNGDKKATSAGLSYGLSNIDVTKIVHKADSIELKEQPKVEKPREMICETEAAHIVNRHLIEVQAARGDSDSMVSDSGGEDVEETFKHRVKRRKVLTPMDRNNTPKTELAASKTPSSERSVDEAVETGKDFSADEDKDGHYKPPSAKEKRKKTGRASKAAKNVHEKKAPRARATPASKNISKKPKPAKKRQKKADLVAEQTDDVESEKPPESADLRFALLLEKSEVTSTPRINLQDLKAAEGVVQRYINTVPSSVPTHAAGSQINEKRAAARKRLEEKMAAGKLNENYVTINIQKKVFTRGKKSINFSRYKKKQWKHKKHIAALTGPDMNMGGCDGGVLKCFTCGQVGHFAANCKVKGDSLLPLTAQLAEDPSPFPTLEEAERMAAQSAVAVHSLNITRLPAAPNAAIYSNIKNTEEIESASAGNGDVEDGVASGESESEALQFESDEELENMDLNAAAPVSPIKSYVGHKIPADFLKKVNLDVEHAGVNVPVSGVGALYDLNADGSVKEATPEVHEALHMFGHTNFRKGQDRAIMRILSGLSTLVTLSTGSGKTLCYQLPAYLYSRRKKSITLVISPLVSLMEDQVTGVPHFLRAHCLHTNQTPTQRLKVLEMIAAGELDILLVSPEAVVAGERSTGFGSILRQLPPIAFACIDEAHCVSQWSHNFRPSYLMICKVLRKNLGVKTVLGLTATATLPTRTSIVSHLGIGDGERGIISDTPLPENLVLSVSRDENKDASLMTLLRSKRFSDCQSIIVYCTRRDECERVASYLRTCLQDHDFAVEQASATHRKRKRLNWMTEPYHAGMPSSRRRTIQNAFMRNELRIVVATIAFGMGINKPDIRAVIHYNMPRNFESYVQEIGRAGRDGNISHCHLFLDARGSDQFELRRHIYANSIDRHVIRKLLQRIFVPCACDKNAKNLPLEKGSADAATSDIALPGEVSDLAVVKQQRKHNCPGHEIGFSIQQTVEALDIPEENISTLLCYLELDSRWGVNVLSSAYIMAKVISYGGAKYLKHAAKECPPLAMAIALEIKKNTFKDDANIIEFCVVDIAAAIGWNSGVVKYQLKNLEWIQVDGCSRRSPISVNFYDLGFRLKAPGDFAVEEIDDALDTLYKRSVKQEQTQLIQLQYVFQGLSSVAYNTCMTCTSDTFSLTRSDQLKGIIRDYFQHDYPKDMKLEIECNPVADDCVEDDVHGIINMYPDNSFSGRSIARIFHGISSPNYPAVMWGRCKYWRAHCKVDFNRIVQMANAVIVKRRT